MREYLFEAKRVDNGEWVEGSLIYGNKRNPNGSIKTIECVYICWAFYDNIKYYAEVDPETVGQFTGLTDKKGKRIFEGDILSCWYDETSKNIRQTVKVFFEKGQFVVDHYAIKTLFDRNTTCEVIGNVHDNKELLNVKLIRISIGALEDCVNKDASYGEICVRCNCCGRFDDDKGASLTAEQKDERVYKWWKKMEENE